MRFLTDSECEEWKDGHGINAETYPYRFETLFPGKQSQQLYFARLIVEAVAPCQTMLLHVTQTDVWPSSENWHLYERLRASYGDSRDLDDAPGHVFREYERADCVTFVQLAVMCGWDAYLYGWPAYGKVFISHDEFVRVEGTYEGFVEQHQSPFMELH